MRGVCVYSVSLENLIKRIQILVPRVVLEEQTLKDKSAGLVLRPLEFLL